MPITTDEAVAAVAAATNVPAEGTLVASPVGDVALWAVHIEDSQGRPAAGGAWLVGPDAQVFSISSNLGIHDWDLAERLLARIYREGIGGAVDPGVFAERLRRLTEEREALVSEVLTEARAGSLRSVHRALP
jgi:hypothetical protein